AALDGAAGAEAEGDAGAVQNVTDLMGAGGQFFPDHGDRLEPAALFAVRATTAPAIQSLPGGTVHRGPDTGPAAVRLGSGIVQGSSPPPELDGSGSTATRSMPKSRSRSSSPYRCAWSRTSPTSTVWPCPGSSTIPSKADSKRSPSRPRRTMRYLPPVMGQPLSPRAWSAAATAAR